jgi:hypothetical protein
MTNLDLCDKSTIWRDAIPAILNVMEGIFPRNLEVLHDEHDHECRRGRDTAWNRGEGNVCQLSGGSKSKFVGEEFVRTETPRSLNRCLTVTGAVEPRLNCAPLQWTRTRPPPRIAPSINALVLKQTKSFNRTRIGGLKPRHPHAGKYRMRFCSSESARSTTMYLK